VPRRGRAFGSALAYSCRVMSPKLALYSVLLLGPAAVAAQPNANALTFQLELESAPSHQAAVPNVSVHVPAGFDADQPLHLVVYLHGLRGCLPVLMGKGSSRCDPQSPPQLGWDLGAHHDAAGTNTIFVVPRLLYGKRGGQPGAFGKPGGFRVFVSELVQGPLSTRLGRPLTAKSIASITLVAHSAGYETTLAILERGEVEPLIRAVVLLDALYAFEDRYARYARDHASDGFRLITVSLRGGKPARNSSKLGLLLVRALGREAVAEASASELGTTVATHPFVIAEGRGGHAKIPERHMAEVLASIGLPERAPPRP
jgi:hypothetical protein